MYKLAKKYPCEVKAHSKYTEKQIRQLGQQTSMSKGVPDKSAGGCKHQRELTDQPNRLVVEFNTPCTAGTIPMPRRSNYSMHKLFNL